MIVIILMVLIPVLVIVACVSIFSFVRAVIHRSLFYKRISQICKTKKYKLTFSRNFFAPFFKYSNKPDIIIKTSDKNYLIRIITCKSKSLIYKFPSPEWYVSFEKIISAPINPTGRFRHLPTLNELYYNDNIDNKPIMVFAPYVPKISYLTVSSTKREVLEKSDSIDGWSVYSAKDLLNAL